MLLPAMPDSWLTPAVCKEDAAALQEKITAAVKQGADEENAFRSVKAGDLVKGFPAEIRFSVKQVGK